ncbi:hypothetical protein FVEG_05422 [Fusarium verticillioides 7600]|uniref:Uncharacterized protein n=1 Tax=Gibberella moniliformis (strain M3125 / FGSC 7600) TaxID=334819 RepID=W7MHP0_GIBM7|nr:hypothetical protein FVEG_05422 [Fusarium verticillioides 7600]EWG44327.1 hypothetical protein FVEG_05422 [Fusarium verticillioides 7600]
MTCNLCSQTSSRASGLVAGQHASLFGMYSSYHHTNKDIQAKSNFWASSSCPVQYSVSPRVVIAHSQQTIVARRVRLLQRRHTQFLADLDLPRAQIAH